MLELVLDRRHCVPRLRQHAQRLGHLNVVEAAPVERLAALSFWVETQVGSCWRTGPWRRRSSARVGCLGVRGVTRTDIGNTHWSTRVPRYHGRTLQGTKTQSHYLTSWYNNIYLEDGTTCTCALAPCASSSKTFLEDSSLRLPPLPLSLQSRRQSLSMEKKVVDVEVVDDLSCHERSRQLACRLLLTPGRLD